MAGRDDLVDFYRALSLHRAVASRLESLREQGHIPRDARSGRGYEAVSVGAASALRPAVDGSGDALALTPCNPGALFAFGGTPLDLFRQHLARGSAPSGGRESDIRFSDIDRGLVGSVASPGTMVEVMAGATLAFRLRRQDRVGVVFSQEDETATSAWHEGINFAAARRCPLIVVVQAGDAASTASHTRAPDFTRKAAGYGIASETVDAADVLEVRRAVLAAARRARAGEGATLVEARGCPVARRSLRDRRSDAGPRDQTGARDPVGRFRAWLLDEADTNPAVLDETGTVSALLDEVEREARASAREACEQALAESQPAGEEALGDVYTDDSPSPPWYRPDPAGRGLAQAAAT